MEELKPQDIRETDLDHSIPVVDSHFHIYDPLTHPNIDESQQFFLDELEKAAEKINLIGSVHMQLSWEQPRTLYESVRLVQLEEKNDKAMPNGMVVWAPMDKGPAFFEKILKKHMEIAGSRVVGTRHLFFYTSKFHRNNDNPNLLRSKAFRECFAVLSKYKLTWDACGHAWQLPQVMELALAFPETTIVVDHCGHPYGVDDSTADACTDEIRSLSGEKADREFALWEIRITKLAQSCPNVHCKVSGLAHELCLATRPYYDQLCDDWKVLPTLWEKYIKVVLQAFGPERCMWASNFPVDGHRGISYVDNWRAYKAVFDSLGVLEDDQRAIFADNAIRVYGLERHITKSLIV